MLSHLEQQTGTRWVVIPKSRRDLLVVNSMTAAWGPLVDWMELFLEDRETVHLAPHVLDDGRWREFVPQIQPEAAQRIRLLALRSQGRIQANTLSVLRAGESKGIDFVAPFGTYENDGEFITYAAVSLDLDATSVPRVERVEFVVGEKEIHEIFFEHLVARLSHLIRPHPGSYPPRWIVSKPSDADLKLIGELAI